MNPSLSLNPTSRTPSQVTELTQATKKWYRVLAPYTSEKVIQCALKVINHISENLRCTSDAPLPVKLALIETQQLFGRYAELLPNLTCDQANQTYPMISELILDTITRPREYGEAVAKLFLYLIARGWMDRILNHENKEAVLSSIRITFSAHHLVGELNCLPQSTKKECPMYAGTDASFSPGDALTKLRPLKEDKLSEMIDHVISKGGNVIRTSRAGSLLLFLLDKLDSISVAFVRKLIKLGDAGLKKTILIPYVEQAEGTAIIPLRRLRAVIALWKRDGPVPLDRLIADNKDILCFKAEILNIVIVSGHYTFSARRTLKWLGHRNHQCELEEILQVFKRHGFNFHQTPLIKTWAKQSDTATHFLIHETNYPFGKRYKYGQRAIHYLVQAMRKGIGISKIRECIGRCLDHGETLWEEDGSFVYVEAATAFGVLCQLGRVKELREFPSEVPSPCPLGKAVESGDLETVKWVFQEAPTSGIPLKMDPKLLKEACLSGTAEIIHFLLNLYREQGLVCEVDIWGLCSLGGYAFYQSIVSQLTLEEKRASFKTFDTHEFYQLNRDQKITKEQRTSVIADIANYCPSSLSSLFFTCHDYALILEICETYPNIEVEPEYLENLAFALLRGSTEQVRKYIPILRRSVESCPADKSDEISQLTIKLFMEVGKLKPNEETLYLLFSNLIIKQESKISLYDLFGYYHIARLPQIWRALKRCFDRIEIHLTKKYMNGRDYSFNPLKKIIYLFHLVRDESCPNVEVQEFHDVILDMTAHVYDNTDLEFIRDHKLSLDRFKTMWSGVDPKIDAVGIELFLEVLKREGYPGDRTGGNTPLHLACRLEWPGLIRRLKELGYSPLAMNHKGRTPWDYAKETEDFATCFAVLDSDF